MQHNAQLRRTSAAVAAFLCVTTAVGMHRKMRGGQATSSYMATQRTLVLPVVVYQPDSPITFEDVTVASTKRGVCCTLFRVRNRSNVPISSYEVQAISQGGGNGQTLTQKLGRPLLPGETSPDSMHAWDLAPGSSSNAPNDRLSYVIYLMVVRATMADGTVFDDSKVFESLQLYSLRSAECLAALPRSH